MADEALRELLAELRRTLKAREDMLRIKGMDVDDPSIGYRGDPDYYRRNNVITAKVRARVDAVESALSELARLRALRDHGKYLADAAEIYLNVMSDDDPEPDLSADSYGTLRSCVYEFRKRFAQTSPVQSHEEKQG